jgi:hypothetical protein
MDAINLLLFLGRLFGVITPRWPLITRGASPLDTPTAGTGPQPKTGLHQKTGPPPKKVAHAG